MELVELLEVVDVATEEFPILSTREEWSESGTKILFWKVMFCDEPQEIK
jgi:hypothetical protein